MTRVRFHPLLGRLQLCRAAIVGLAFLVEVAAWCWLPMVGADDRGVDPQAAAELAVRKRILANWQARQDRIKSFYVAWKPGPNDRTPKWEKAGLLGVHQQWMAADDRFRVEFPTFAFGQPLSVGHRQQVFDGKCVRTLWTPLKIAAADGTLGNLPAGRFPEGSVRALKDVSERRQNSPDGAEMLAYRPLQAPWTDWTLENSRVTSQNAIVGRRHYVKIEKSDAESGITEACWVDPARDDLVLHFQREFWEGSEEWISLEYKRDPRHGWVLTGWQGESRDIREGGVRKPMGETIVTEYRINEDFPPETFQFKFPAGAIFVDSETKRHYFVRRDGSQREFDRSELGKWITYQQLVNEDTTRPAKRSR
jgi:hypothetical protein